MLRIILTYLIPFVLPAAAWFVWQKFFAKSPALGGATRIDPHQVPWHWLGLAGLVLAAATLTTLGVFGGASPGEVYQPAEMIDGKITPGKHVPAERR
jgi:Family of unknown function (DUF6111)